MPRRKERKQYKKKKGENEQIEKAREQQKLYGNNLRYSRALRLTLTGVLPAWYCSICSILIIPNFSHPGKQYIQLNLRFSQVVAVRMSGFVRSHFKYVLFNGAGNPDPIFHDPLSVPDMLSYTCRPGSWIPYSCAPYPPAVPVPVPALPGVHRIP